MKSDFFIWPTGPQGTGPHLPPHPQPIPLPWFTVPGCLLCEHPELIPTSGPLHLLVPLYMMQSSRSNVIFSGLLHSKVGPSPAPITALSQAQYSYVALNHYLKSFPESMY